MLVSIDTAAKKYLSITGDNDPFTLYLRQSEARRRALQIEPTFHWSAFTLIVNHSFHLREDLSQLGYSFDPLGRVCFKKYHTKEEIWQSLQELNALESKIIAADDRILKILR